MAIPIGCFCSCLCSRFQLPMTCLCWGAQSSHHRLKAPLLTPCEAKHCQWPSRPRKRSQVNLSEQVLSKSSVLEAVVRRDVDTAFLPSGRTRGSIGRGQAMCYWSVLQQKWWEGRDRGHRSHQWATLAIAFEVLHGEGLTRIELQQPKKMHWLGVPRAAGYLLLLNYRDLWGVLSY